MVSFSALYDLTCISVKYIQISKERIYSPKVKLVLTDVAQWIEHQPANEKVTGVIPSQGTHLICGPVPW